MTSPGINNRDTTMSDEFDPYPRLLTPSEREDVIEQILAMNPKIEKTTQIHVFGWWQGELRWVRNRVNLASDRRNIGVQLVRRSRKLYAPAIAITNQVDPASLRGLLDGAERALVNRVTASTLDQFGTEAAKLPRPSVQVWSELTFNETAENRSRLARALTEGAEAKGYLAAGYIEMRGAVTSVYDPWGNSADRITHYQSTLSQGSMTVREPNGIGSGWAGLSSFDWSAIDPAMLAKMALDKCEASVNPVAIEPGRYTAILEPQAVYGLVNPIFQELQNRQSAESPNGSSPFFLEYDSALNLSRTKLGLKIVDERVTISHDPLDPVLGIVPEPGVDATTYIKNGVLTAMGYQRQYAIHELNDNMPVFQRKAFRMSGGTTSIEEMIANTERGVVVTRFSNTAGVDRKSMLMTGFTRDGLWLIERGKIAKAIKNFRFTESPLFVLNNIIDLGTPVPLFSPSASGDIGLMPALVPPLKVRDFSFTSMIDAV